MKKYKTRAQLLMTDTDSLLFSCNTEDIYQDMKASLDDFDTSDFPKNTSFTVMLIKRSLENGKMRRMESLYLNL